MTSVFSWQNSVSLWSASFCTPGTKLPVTPDIFLLPTLHSSPLWWKGHLFWVLVLEDFVGLHQFSSVQSLSHVWLFVTPWTAAHQASLSIANSRSLLKLMSIELVMPSNHLLLCYPLLLLPSIFPSIRVFSNESVLCIRWPKYWIFNFSISPSNEYSGLISFRWTGWISLQSKGLSRVFSNTTVQKHQFFCTQLSFCTHIHTWLLEKPQP